MAEDSFSDKLFECCLNTFNKLPKNGKPNTLQWTVLSAFILEDKSGDSI